MRFFLAQKSLSGLQLSSMLMCMGWWVTGGWVAQLGAQTIPVSDKELVVQFRTPADAAPAVALWNRTHPEHAVDTFYMCSEMLGAWCLRVAEGQGQAVPALKNWLVRHPRVLCAQRNLSLSPRNGSLLPDDPLFSQQWHLYNTGQGGGTPGADLGAPDAWAFHSDAITPTGDTVVVAVIDGGIDQQHVDLLPNLWVNYGDWPNDGLDNDQNGYSDDHLGWNVFQQNDNIASADENHGTQVAGILAAAGNNSLGVAGVVWQTKMLFVAGTGTVASLLQAYDYVWKTRKRYNQTQGAEGAFVVAVNCSWGINYAHPEDAPLWCAALDSLGKAGILSVAPVSNLPVNIDQSGDLPGLCPSPYLITTTSLNHVDALVAAWGSEHVDLGAYGQAVVTTDPGNAYGVYAGTSLASPQLAGALALLHGADCPELAEQTASDPAAAALWARHKLLRAAIPNNDMLGKSVTGGRLHLGNLLALAESGCGECPAPFDLTAIVADGGSVALDWTPLIAQDTFRIRWKPEKDTLWQEMLVDGPPVLLTGVKPCVSYACDVQARCSEGWSASTSGGFSTSGCCVPPDVAVTAWPDNRLQVHWPAVTGGQAYRLEWSADISGAWQMLTSLDTQAWLADLLPCTRYYFRLSVLCETEWSAPGASTTWQTAGCGACTDSVYCTSEASDATSAWMAQFTLGAWQQGGLPGAGYEDHSDVPADVLTLYSPGLYEVLIKPDAIGAFQPHFFRIFIDFNADGDFDDAGEVAFDPGFALDEAAVGWLETPAVLAEKNVRMRVSMKRKTPLAGAPEPCETFDFGQVKDYCIVLQPFVSDVKVASTRLEGLLLSPNPAGSAGTWLMRPLPVSSGILSVHNAQGRLLYEREVGSAEQAVFLPAGQWPGGMYLVTLRGERAVWQAWLCRQQ
ncbi:MAG: S8 family serine peptidase [Saprospiraceae bacterium]|nr:S8 family serine peptidase [Saprospiraceae bacterium]